MMQFSSKSVFGGCLGAVLVISGCGGGGTGEVRTTDQASNSTQQINQQNDRVRTVRAQSNRELKAFAVEELLRLSSNQSPEIRANTIEAFLGRSDSLESIVALGLSDRNVGVRSIAAMVAGKQQFEALLPTLESMDTDDSPFVRASALFAMDRITPGSVDLTPIATMLFESEDIRVSSHAAYLLGELGNDSAILPLKQAATRSWGQKTPIQRQIYRLQIAEALMKLGDMSSIDVVRSALYPSRPEELEATALAVQIIGEVQDRGAIDQLIYLVDEDADRPMPAEVRLAIAGALAKLGLREGGFIADQYVDNSNDPIRSQAAIVFGQTGQEQHLGQLEAMLSDPSAMVRAASAGAILEILKSR